MAVKRTCPKCGKEWVSADAEHPWECGNCGAVIGVELSRDCGDQLNGKAYSLKVIKLKQSLDKIIEDISAVRSASSRA